MSKAHSLKASQHWMENIKIFPNEVKIFIMIMKTLSFIGILVAVTCHLKGIAAERLLCPENNHLNWSFDGTTNGPTEWGEKYPLCEQSEMQSPIDIISSDTDKCIGPLETRNYDIPVGKAEIVNLGLIVWIVPKDGVTRSIKVNNEFRNLTFFELHWGSNGCRGSEHTIDGQRYALELQFFHTLYNDPTSSLNRSYVLSVLYTEVEEDNPSLQPIIDALPEIQFRKQKTNLASELELRDGNGDAIPIFQYDGSLAVPDCQEHFKWSIDKKIWTVGRSQMAELRKLYSVPTVDDNGPTDPSKCRISDNFRPLQPVNGRTVYEST